MNTSGEFIVAGDDGGGFRDFLIGAPIHAGDRIQWWSAEDQHWIAGRYEMDYHSKTGYFYPQAAPGAGAPAVIEIDRATMAFRWPTPDDL